MPREILIDCNFLPEGDRPLPTVKIISDNIMIEDQKPVIKTYNNSWEVVKSEIEQSTNDVSLLDIDVVNFMQKILRTTRIDTGEEIMPSEVIIAMKDELICSPDTSIKGQMREFFTGDEATPD
jgi:hypothetical protein